MRVAKLIRKLQTIGYNESQVSLKNYHYISRSN